MQPAPPIAVVSPAHAHAAYDVVSPSKLFTLAETRFNVALRVVGNGDLDWVPSSLAASVAIREAQGGIGALKSVLVPSTPWGPRQIAATALLHARRAVDQLEEFSAIMASRGEGPFRREDAPLGSLAHLDTARAALRRAITAVS